MRTPWLFNTAGIGLERGRDGGLYLNARSVARWRRRRPLPPVPSSQAMRHRQHGRLGQPAPRSRKKKCSYFSVIVSYRDAQSLCDAQIIADTFMNRAGNGCSGAKSSENGVFHGPQGRFVIGSAEPPPPVPTVRTPDGDHGGDTSRLC
jgi:hypothetical protein